MKKYVIFESHESLMDMNSQRLLIFNKLVKNKYFKKLVVISEVLKKFI